MSARERVAEPGGLVACGRTASVPEASGEVEGLTGIEPALSAWEAEVLPLNYSPAPDLPRNHAGERMLPSLQAG